MTGAMIGRQLVEDLCGDWGSDWGSGLSPMSACGGVLEVSSVWNLRTDINSPGCLTTLGHFMSSFNSFHC